MARQKKDGRSVSFYLDRALMEKVEEHAKENGQTLTMAVERLVQKGLEDTEKETASEKTQH